MTLALHPDAVYRERFAKKRTEGAPDECWLWRGAIQTRGYGSFGFRGKVELAHRSAYELFVGPIPDGLTIDHTCHNDSGCRSTGKDCLHRRCVNPAHLEPVTVAVNNNRGNRYLSKWAS